MNIFPRVVKFFSASTIRTVTVLYGTLLFALVFNLVILPQEKVGTNTSRVADLSLPECVIDTTKDTALQNSCRLTADLRFETNEVKFYGNNKTIDGMNTYKIIITKDNVSIYGLNLVNGGGGGNYCGITSAGTGVLISRIKTNSAICVTGTGTLSDNTIANIPTNGIHLSVSASVEVKNNSISEIGEKGIAVDGNAKVSNILSFPDGNTFKNNALGNCIGNGFTNADKHGGICPDQALEVCQTCEDIRPLYAVPGNPVTYAYYHAYGNNQCCAGLSGTFCHDASIKSCPGSTASTPIPIPTRVPTPIPTLSTPWPPEKCSKLTALKTDRPLLYKLPDADTKICPTDYPICNIWQINSSNGYGGGCVKAYTLPPNEYCGTDTNGITGVQDMVCKSNKCNYNPTKARDKDGGIYTIGASGTCAYEIKKIGEECVPDTDYQRCENWPNTWCSNTGLPNGATPICQTKPTPKAPVATSTPTPRVIATPAPKPIGESCTRPSQCASKNCVRIGTNRSGTCQAAATPTTVATISIRPPDTTATPPTGNPPGGATGAPTGNQQETVAIVLDLKLPGVGTSAPNNTNPHRPTRLATVYLFDAKNDLAKTIKGDASYNGTTGSYLGTIAISNLPAGQYRVEAGFDNTLQTKIPGIITTTQQNTTLPAATLISGDIEHNNVLDLRDYNAFVSCFGTKSCAGNLKVLSDLNADGPVNEKDLNILLRSFAIQQGD